jgi:hypothetical protein
MVLAVCLDAHTLFAGKSSEFVAVRNELRAVTPAEMPARASQLVSQAGLEVREATAETVVTVSSALRPVAVVAVVGAISHDNPAVAPAAAAKAAGLQPKQAADIARAAASAAPAQAAKIVYAVCKVVPMRYSTVATAVAQVVPDASKEILAAVTEAMPGLKPFVERSGAGNANASVGVIMAQTESLAKITAQAAKTTPEKLITAPVLASGTPSYALPPPVEGPPYWPVGTPTTLTPTNAVEIPPGGGRNYSGP